MAAESPAALTLARVLRPWGRRGQVAAQILTDFPERLSKLERVWLARGDGAAADFRREATIVSSRVHKRQVVIQFEGVASIDDAEKLRGLLVQVPLSDRVVLPEGRYYISDLVGCAVWEQGAAAELGTVRDVQPLAQAGATAVAWVLAVATTAGGEMLVPMAEEICTAIDIAERRIVVRLPEGLRALNK